MKQRRIWVVVASMGIGFALACGAAGQEAPKGAGSGAGAGKAAAGKPVAAGKEKLSDREQRLAARRDSKLNEEVAAVFKAADTTYLVGDVSRAADGFGKVLSMAPASNFSVRAQARLGDCAYEQKKFDEAATLYRRAASANTDEVTDEVEKTAGIRADYMVGQAYLVARNYTTCFGAFRKFIDRHPQHVLVNMAYQCIGDAHLALEQYQQALVAYRMVGTVVPQKTAAMKRLTPGGRLYLRVTDADVNVGETPRGVKAILKTTSGDPGLDAVLSEIELRVEVELAKAGQF